MESKKTYQKPESEKAEFKVVDVLTVSGGTVEQTTGTEELTGDSD